VLTIITRLSARIRRAQAHHWVVFLHCNTPLAATSNRHVTIAYH